MPAVRDRADALRAAERLARLQTVTARLAGASTVEDVASVIVDHAAAGIGAQSAVFLELVDDGEMFEVVRQIGLDSETEEEFATFAVDAPLPAGDAVRTGSIVVIADAADRDARYPALAARPTREGTHVVAPLADDDRAYGAVAFGYRRTRNIDDEDRRFLLAIAAQAAQTMRRIRMVESERAARRRQEFLARATGVLAGAVDHEAAATAIGRLAVQDFTDTLTVHIRDGGELRTIAAVDADAKLEAALQEVLATPHGRDMVQYLDDLVADGRSILADDLDEAAWQKTFAGMPGFDEGALAHIGSAVIVGLHTGGVRNGVLCATRRGSREPFDHDAFVVLSELAGRLASAIATSLAHRARSEVARTLQASLLPPRLPEIPGVVVASRYDPIGDGSLVGGDFYDVFPMADGAWALVIGDVCGQGVLAAALTSLVRYTIRAAARMWPSPSEILRFTNTAVLEQEGGERFCTVLLCVLRSEGDGADVTIAAGGHHLPLHVPAGQAPRPVGAVGTALGLIDELEVTDVTIHLSAGDLLVMTTDGVLEARDPNGDVVGEEFLDDLVRGHAPDGAEAVAGAIERAVLAIGGGRARDDVAVLIAEIVGDRERGATTEPAVAPDGVGPFDERYPAAVESVTNARRAVAAWLAAQPIARDRRPDLLLAVTELATNAVRAARTAVDVRCWLTDDAVMAEVTDDGPGFDAAFPRHVRELDLLAERGRGLFLVDALVDECTIESGPNGTIVRCYITR
jgi:GAF domain-containing protein/anti-sigma regulatory factor (Ser/Thr protein kinase)